MKGALLLVLVYIWRCESAVITSADDRSFINNRPIIGVLSQEQSTFLHSKFPKEDYTSYIAASYIKDLESAGARVVPILIGKDRSYYKQIMAKLNGVLFPGGGAYFKTVNGYADAGQHIYEIAQEMNNAGDYFPIFGTCLGFELLVILASGRGSPENRIHCYSFGNLPLKFTKDFRQGKLFRNAPEHVIHTLSTEASTVNEHYFCIVDKNLEKFNLTKDWQVTSHSDDFFGIEFIASIEHRRYPFYGVQFHPEKPSYEWKLTKKYVDSIEAIKANRHFMDFFVNECRKSPPKFADEAEENRYLIYNYKAHFTGVLGSMFNQCYMFEPRGIA